MKKLNLPRLIGKLELKEPVRICAFGSSNTQRFAAGVHWFDCLELGIKQTYGLQNLFFNAGACGEDSSALLKRLDRDVLSLKPDLVIVTVGGNDSYRTDKIPPEVFYQNLLELHRRITETGSEIVFQTYYACDLEKMPEGHPMPDYMELIRKAAKETDSPLMDNWTRWDRLRKTDVLLYRTLMRDHMHLNPLGNLLLGCDWIEALSLTVPDHASEILAPGRFAQKVLDLLEKQWLTVSCGNNSQGNAPRIL